MFTAQKYNLIPYSSSLQWLIRKGSDSIYHKKYVQMSHYCFFFINNLKQYRNEVNMWSICDFLRWRKLPFDRSVNSVECSFNEKIEIKHTFMISISSIICLACMQLISNWILFISFVLTIIGQAKYIKQPMVNVCTLQTKKTCFWYYLSVKCSDWLQLTTQPNS